MNLCAYCGAVNENTTGTCWSCDKPMTAPVPRVAPNTSQVAIGSRADIRPERVAAALSGLDRRQKRAMVSLTALVFVGVALAFGAFVLRHQLLEKRKEIPGPAAQQAIAAPVAAASPRQEVSPKDALATLFGNFDAATQTAILQSSAPPEGWSGNWPGRQRVAVHQVSPLDARGDQRVILMILTDPEADGDCSGCKMSLGAAVLARSQGRWLVETPAAYVGSTSDASELSEAVEVTALTEDSWAVLLSERADQASASTDILRVIVLQPGAISLALESQTAYRSTGVQPCEACAGEWMARPRFVRAAGEPVPQMMLEFSGVDAQGRAVGRTEQYRFAHGEYQLTAEAGSPDPREGTAAADAPPAQSETAQQPQSGDHPR